MLLQGLRFNFQAPHGVSHGVSHLSVIPVPGDILFWFSGELDMHVVGTHHV